MNMQQQISNRDYQNKPFNVNYKLDTFQFNMITANELVNDSEADIEDTEDCDEVKSIFLCKFHATAGPQIAAQVPKNYVSKELFENVSSYIIPKVSLQRSFVSV